MKTSSIQLKRLIFNDNLAFEFYYKSFNDSFIQPLIPFEKCDNKTKKWLEAIPHYIPRCYQEVSDYELLYYIYRDILFNHSKKEKIKARRQYSRVIKEVMAFYYHPDRYLSPPTEILVGPEAAPVDSFTFVGEGYLIARSRAEIQRTEAH